MIEKWEQRAIGMNFKKAVIIFLITAFALMIAGSAALYGNFQNRIANWEQISETDREHEEEERDSKEKDFKEKDSKGREEMDLEDIYGKFHLSWGDLALLAGCAVAG